MSNRLGSFLGVSPSKLGRDRFSPQPISTGYSSMDASGNVMIDPSIRALQDQRLGYISSGTEDYLSKNSDLRKRYLGNQSAFRQAIVNPLERKFAQGRSELQQGLGLRRVSGSSFGDQAIQGYDTDAGRAIGEAGAMAEMQDLQALTGLDSNALSAMFQRANAEGAIGQQRLVQELSALGLSQDRVNQMLNAWNASQNRDQQSFTNQMNTWFKHNETAQNWTKIAAAGGGAG